MKKVRDYLLDEEECSAKFYNAMYVLAIVLPIVTIVISEIVRRG